MDPRGLLELGDHKIKLPRFLRLFTRRQEQADLDAQVGPSQGDGPTRSLSPAAPPQNTLINPAVAIRTAESELSSLTNSSLGSDAGVDEPEGSEYREEGDDDEGSQFSNGSEREGELEAAIEVFDEPPELHTAHGRIALLESFVAERGADDDPAELQAGSLVVEQMVTRTFKQPPSALWTALFMSLASGLPLLIDGTTLATSPTLKENWVRLFFSGAALRSITAVLDMIPGSARITSRPHSLQVLAGSAGGVYVHFINVPARLIQLLTSVLQALPFRVHILLDLLVLVPVVDGFITLVYWGIWTDGLKSRTLWDRYINKDRADPVHQIQYLIYAINSNPVLKAGCTIHVASLWRLATFARISKDFLVSRRTVLAVLESVLIALTPRDVGLVNVFGGEGNISGANAKDHLAGVFAAQFGYMKSRAKALMSDVDDRLKAIAQDDPAALQLLRIDFYLRTAQLNPLMFVKYHEFGHRGQRPLAGRRHIGTLCPTFDLATGTMKSVDKWRYVYVRYQKDALPTTINHAYFRFLLCYKEPYPEGVIKQPRLYILLYAVNIVDGHPVEQIVRRFKVNAPRTRSLLADGCLNIGLVLGDYDQDYLDGFTRAIKQVFLDCHLCDKVFLWYLSHIQHMKVVHPDARTCKLCGDTFRTLISLATHERDDVCFKDGKKTDALVCNYQPEVGGSSDRCPLRLPNLNALHTHRHHQHKVAYPLRPDTYKLTKRAIDAPADGHPCQRCDALFATEGDLEYHQRKAACVKGDVKFPPPKCQHCPWHFDSEGAQSPYRLHMERYHGSLSTVCSKCHTRFASIKRIVEHFDICDGNPPTARCPRCYRFICIQHAKRHARECTAKKPTFDICEKCGQPVSKVQSIRAFHSQACPDPKRSES